MALLDINLSESEMAEVKDKLDAWRVAEKKKMEEELTEKFEQMEAELKEHYENLVEEIKENMKKLYTKRFTKALKEMYEEIKAEVIVESLNSPEVKALEDIKAAVFPFINESTARRYKDEFGKLAQMYEGAISELEMAKGAKKKAELMKSLSPEVGKVVDKLLGEGTEEEIVTKFAAIKDALKTQTEETTPPAKPVAESRRPAPAVVTEDDHHEEVAINRQVERETTTEVIAESEEKKEFSKLLNEQLVLAGIRRK